MDPLQLLGMVLDLTDAVLGVLALVSFWYAWVMPARKDPPTSPHLSERAEIERFLQEARACTGAAADHVRKEPKEQVKGALGWSRER